MDRIDMNDKNNFLAKRMSLIKPSPTMAVTKLAAEMKAQGKNIIDLTTSAIITFELYLDSWEEIDICKKNIIFTGKLRIKLFKFYSFII